MFNIVRCQISINRRHCIFRGCLIGRKAVLIMKSNTHPHMQKATILSKCLTNHRKDIMNNLTRMTRMTWYKQERKLINSPVLTTDKQNTFQKKKKCPKSYNKKTLSFLNSKAWSIWWLKMESILNIHKAKYFRSNMIIWKVKLKS